MKLKPCPFCGGEKIETVEFEVAGTDSTYVVCVNCGSCTKLHYQKEQAIEAWNRRTPLEDIVEQLEGLTVGTVLCDKCEYREKCDDIQEKYNPDDDTDLCTMVAKSLAIEIVKGNYDEV